MKRGVRWATGRRCPKCHGHMVRITPGLNDAATTPVLVVRVECLLTKCGWWQRQTFVLTCMSKNWRKR